VLDKVAGGAIYKSELPADELRGKLDATYSEFNEILADRGVPTTQASLDDNSPQSKKSLPDHTQAGAGISKPTKQSGHYDRTATIVGALVMLLGAAGLVWWKRRRARPAAPRQGELPCQL
jgi:LPXTG-motif cell wall-anchored protein